MSHAVRELLEFYTAAGVDCALEDTPQDRFAESELALVARNVPVALQGVSKAFQTPLPATRIQSADTARTENLGSLGNQHRQALVASQGFGEAPAKTCSTRKKSAG